MRAGGHVQAGIQVDYRARDLPYLRVGGRALHAELTFCYPEAIIFVDTQAIHDIEAPALERLLFVEPKAFT
jgi:hypothetical protein